MKKMLPSQLEILYELSLYGAMTEHQVTRALGRPTMSTWYARMLKEMAETGYTWRKTMEVRARDSGRYANIYGVERPALEVIRKEYGEHPGLRVLSADKRDHYTRHLHDLTINDVLLHARSLHTEVPAWQSLRVWHERALQKVMTGQPAIPDGYMLFAYGDRRDVILLEVDESGKEGPKQWKAKVGKLMRMMEDPTFVADYAPDGIPITIAVAVTARHGRLENLMRWTEEADPNAAKYFLFCDELPTTMSAAEYFTGRHWQGSGHTRPMILLDTTLP